MNTVKGSVKPKRILILGSGGLRIGQAGEFDYSGSQAIKAFKSEGIKTILINPNIATVQTDPDMADVVYFLPLTVEFVARVIAKEKPDAIALSFGGQTALNVGLALEDTGVLKKHHVRVLGTPTKSIRLTEDRDLFANALRAINVPVAKSVAVTTVAAAKRAASQIGYPIMIRSAFALGGEGSSKINNQRQLMNRVTEALANVPQVLIEEYLGGWKEIEYEVVRDNQDNCITVCNMENLDPMGIHTGESVVVAPSQTLSNREYHLLRTVAQQVVRHLGIVGECNIQYALDPASLRYRVIEVNARLSRSSALASKATGYPLAYVAAKLALGYSLVDLQNSVTKSTMSCFEPALDYVAVKIPRWDLKKFKSADHTISTEMKSVGEIMAIGRTFTEALQKGIRMLGAGDDGMIANARPITDYMADITLPTDRRLLALAAALEDGHTVQKLHHLTKIDPWFLNQINRIVLEARSLKKAKLTKDSLRSAKQLGFSDQQIGRLIHQSAESVRRLRKRYRILPVVKQIDTLAGEYPAKTNYLYFTYHGTEHDVTHTKRGVIVLGSGPYRIGSSVEFDWCCVQAVKTIREQKRISIMVNCNPETVSTDYDISDRLYFEELTLERILDIVEFEHPAGVIVSMGGQASNNLAIDLQTAKVPILGTSPTDIDRAENRHLFSQLLDQIGLDQPTWKEVTTLVSAQQFAQRVGYPVLIRPSYVLSGAAMNVAFSAEHLMHYLQQAAEVSSKYPVVISKFIQGAREIEFDGVADHGQLKLYAMTEHIENAGVHSGDAHAVFPPQRTYLETIRRTKQRMRDVVKALNITGPFNVQFLAKDNQIKIIELNLRASRSFPFVSKSAKINFARIATEIMLGKSVSVDFKRFDLDYVTVKAPQFSYSRIKGADPILYVEMGSTGEVAAFGDGYQEAVLKAMLAAGYTIPEHKRLLISVGLDTHKASLIPFVKKLAKHHYSLFGTEGTATFFRKQGIKIKTIRKGAAVVKAIEGKHVDCVINIPRQYTHKELTDGYRMRRAAVDWHIPLISNVQIAKIYVNAICNLTLEDLTIKAWHEY
ncbi:MAG: carbamoyl-phosphate synthase (glutamine-hydrolyzing) large subunit [Candidatus Kerfeldbacteria bacterium]|nr:carbamoyl-phosphate synthase (glutamine-hydrolyzing) large subunit [Candidatus Kerfeldbacteria bacterium]